MFPDESVTVVVTDPSALVDVVVVVSWVEDVEDVSWRLPVL
jgi:hypothetical protein